LGESRAAREPRLLTVYDKFSVGFSGLLRVRDFGGASNDLIIRKVNREFCFPKEFYVGNRAVAGG
jgi:hypothetical protein